jgi:hypothetical protein
MKYKDFYEDLLVESRLERYLPILTGADKWTEYDSKHVKAAIDHLKRDDVIQWYLRWMRYLNWKKEENVHNNVGRKYSGSKTKWLRDFESKTGHLNKVENLYGTSMQGTLDLTKISHYLSLPIDKIQSFRFLYQDPREVDSLFSNYEKEWKDSQQEEAQWVDMTEEFKNGDVETLYNFSDGFAWLDLKRNYCSKEGEAMGHCGNRASYKSTDTVLSLRKLQRRGDKIFGRPSLTFILEKNDGKLGEMKGRANAKPDEKYHPYILKLFEVKRSGGNYVVQRIVGGGYAPESNFQLSDLSESDLKNLYLKRPDLKPLMEIYAEEGVSEKLKSAILKRLPEKERDIVEIISDGKYGRVNLTAWDSWESLWADIPSREEPENLNRYKEYIIGDARSEIYFDYSDIDEHSLRDLFDKVRDDKRYNEHDFNEYIRSNYDEAEILDSQENSDVFGLLYQSDDELISQLTTAYIIGRESGTESEIYKSFFDGITNMEFASDSSVDYPFDFYIAYENPSSPYTSKIIQVWNIKDFIKAIDSGVEQISNVLNEVDVSISGDMEEPHYGFSGYNEAEAVNYFFDMLDIR